MARTLKSDKTLLLATLLLVGTSVVMVYSASAVQAMAQHESQAFLLYKQAAWAVIGIVAMLAVMRVDYREYRRPAIIWPLLAVTVVLLVAVFFFDARNSARRWITIGSLSLQPSELAKLAAILFTVALLDRRMHQVNDVGAVFAPIALVVGGLASLIVIEPDLGSAAVLVGVVVTLLFAAGLSYRYLFGTALVLLPVLTAFLLGAGYRKRRLLTFLDPWRDPFGDGYQITNSLIAVGSGGVTGRGLGGSVQKLHYLPEAHTDFIYAVIGEEFGLIGVTVLLLCFVVIAWRGLRASLVAPDRFGSLLALGLTMMIVLQACVNISVVISLLPTKGIPLPFVSSGGSSLVANLAAMGMLLNISQQAALPAGATPVRRSDWTFRGQEA
jgi:cell division protein FtsW